MDDGQPVLAAKHADVALEHIERRVSGAFDCRDPRLTHPDPLGELRLREPGPFPQRGQTPGQSQLLLDLLDTLSSVASGKDLFSTARSRSTSPIYGFGQTGVLPLGATVLPSLTSTMK